MVAKLKYGVGPLEGTGSENVAELDQVSSLVAGEEGFEPSTF